MKLKSYMIELIKAIRANDKIILYCGTPLLSEIR